MQFMRVERMISAGYAELRPTSINGRVEFREILPVNVSSSAASDALPNAETTTASSLEAEVPQCPRMALFSGRINQCVRRSGAKRQGKEQAEAGERLLKLGHAGHHIPLWLKMRADNRVEPSQVMIAFNLQHVCPAFQFPPIIRFTLVDP
ncbi:uncharacterized protein BDV14DRAFT_80842 [Aspergillus stella-maris]|uniref:uncharacterized protein n=1 Tax=Aspergillus stella-maris TaxID=1810926 RepID=UPI003CCD4B8C